MLPNFADLIETQCSALFVESADNGLKYIREPGFAEPELLPAPRFFMSRSPNKNIWRFRYDVPDNLVKTIQHLCLAEPKVTDFTTPHLHASDIRQLLDEHCPITQEWSGPAYWIPKQANLSANTVLITEENAPVLEPYFPWKITSKSNFRTSPVVATVVDNEAVSICYCARITDKASEAGVETVESFRGHGYAGQAVARWAEVIRQSGIIPLYSTSWDKLGSQRVADKLLCVNYGDNFSIT